MRYYILFFLSLAGCTHHDFRCPPLAEYDEEFNRELIEVLEPLTENNPIVVSIRDYSLLRDQIRASCRQ